MSEKTITCEQHRILLVGNWLKRYAAIYPMYGKKLSDFPERFDEFLDEFKTADPGRLDEAFHLARGQSEEFPTPALVRRVYETLRPSEQALDAAYDRLKQRLAAQPEVKMLTSALDEKAQPKRAVAQLTAEQAEARLHELRQQAFNLKNGGSE